MKKIMIIVAILFVVLTTSAHCWAETGRILETLDGGGYIFFQIKTVDGEKKWIASPPPSFEVGELVTFSDGVEMVNFQSKSLRRTFDKIMFVTKIKQTGGRQND
jgi:hypothetical protein